MSPITPSSDVDPFGTPTPEGQRSNTWRRCEIPRAMRTSRQIRQSIRLEAPRLFESEGEKARMHLQRLRNSTADEGTKPTEVDWKQDLSSPPSPRDSSASHRARAAWELSMHNAVGFLSVLDPKDVEELKRATHNGSNLTTSTGVPRGLRIFYQRTGEPTFLPLSLIHDSSYPVTKINQVGKIQRRCIRFTRFGIENIRAPDTEAAASMKPSSFHRYTDVESVTQSGVQTLIISYKDEHKRTYCSASVPEMARELAYRLYTASSGTELNSADTLTSRPPSCFEARESKEQVFTEYDLYQEIAAMLRGSGPYADIVDKFLKNFHSLEKDPASLCPRVRHFLEVLKSKILTSERAETFASLAKEVAAFTADDARFELTAVVERVLQFVILRPLHKRLFRHLKRRGSNSKAAQRQLAQNLSFCKTRGPSVFDIAREHGTYIDWKAAAMELNLMNEYQTPNEMLRALVACIRVVFDSLKSAPVSKTVVISGDELFPIMMYVVTRSSIQRPLVVYDYLMAMADETQLRSEPGYYLTLFGAVLQYLSSEALAVLVKNATTESSGLLSSGGGGGGNTSASSSPASPVLSPVSSASSSPRVVSVTGDRDRGVDGDGPGVGVGDDLVLDIDQVESAVLPGSSSSQRVGCASPEDRPHPETKQLTREKHELVDEGDEQEEQEADVLQGSSPVEPAEVNMSSSEEGLGVLSPL